MDACLAPIARLKHRLAAHEGLENIGHRDAAVLKLVLFHDSDQCPRSSDGSGIERVDDGLVGVAWLAVADTQTVGLIVGTVGAGDDFFVLVCARNPGFQIVFLAATVPISPVQMLTTS